MATKATKKPKASAAGNEVAPVPIQGYRRAPRYEEVEYRPDDLPEDQEGLKATIRTNLSFAEIDAIPYGLKVRFDEIWPVIAQYVTAWNVDGENLETGAWEPVPPPAEAGPEVFSALEQVEALWLTLAIKFGHRQKMETEEGKAGSAPSGSGPETNDEPS